VTPLQAFLYALAVVLLVLAAFEVGKPRVNLALLGAAVALFAYAEPGIVHALGG
jgi:hypothetical protein